jgi:aryl-alcohol dehydrogenase-like predicted oxidoreductase
MVESAAPARPLNISARGVGTDVQRFGSDRERYGRCMRYRPLGASGLVVSVVGLGANNFGGRITDVDRTRAVVDAALDVGINLVDTADIYGGQGGSETQLGEVLEGRREHVLLATKFGMDMAGGNGPDWGARGSRRYIRRAVEASLPRGSRA